MKKIYFLLFACLTGLTIKATSYTVSISGNTYAPASLTITVGDVVTIQASATHPLNEVSATTWLANGSTTLATGWGSKVADHTFTVSAAGGIFYVCQNHVSMGMKGSIVVLPITGINENISLASQMSIFPNPTTSDFNLNFTLNSDANVSAKLINLIGQEVGVLMPNSTLPASDHNYTFETPAAISAGTYFVVVTVNDTRVTKKLIVSK